MNYYERHIGDYLKDTAHLSLLEHGIYTRLLDVYYTRESAIPADQAARLIGARSKEEREALEVVLGEFFELIDGAYEQGRCQREIERFGDKQRKAKASADARWGKTDRNADAMRTHTERIPDASTEFVRKKMRSHSERNADGMHSQSPDTRHHMNTSVPGGTGAADATPAPPPTDRDMVFANGITLLTAAGVSDKNARSFLAAQCKAHGEAAVRQALQRCAEQRPIEPVPWLQAALKATETAPPIAKGDRIAQHNIAVAQRFMERTS